jgi:hypothetical protein
MALYHPACFPALELLEPRRLLSGVTLITHGQGGSAGGAVALTADLVAQRAGGASQYVMKVAEEGRGVKVVSFRRDAGSPTVESVPTGERIIKLDWSDVKLLPTPLIASAVADYMVDARLVEQQLHLAGPSRGASVISNLAAALGRRGVWIDQVTYIDPVPVNVPIPGLGDLVDGPMRVTENVLFADNYWRSDGNILTGFDGQPVDGAYNVELRVVERDNFGDPHVGAGAYYIATVDPNEPIVPPAKSSWFRGSSPARDRTGYRFSRIGGGARPTAGVSAGFDGVAPRDRVARSGPQWPNIDGLKVVGGQRRFTIGEEFTISYRFNDGDSPMNIAFVLDDDRNPYNNWVSTLARRDFGARQTPTLRRAGVETWPLDAGTYFLGARVKDAAGHVRYAYAPYSIDLVAPPANGSVRSLVAEGEQAAAAPGAAAPPLLATRHHSSRIFSSSPVRRIVADLPASDQDTLIQVN